MKIDENETIIVLESLSSSWYSCPDKGRKNQYKAVFKKLDGQLAAFRHLREKQAEKDLQLVQEAQSEY